MCYAVRVKASGRLDSDRGRAHVFFAGDLRVSGVGVGRVARGVGVGGGRRGQRCQGSIHPVRLNTGQALINQTPSSPWSQIRERCRLLSHTLMVQHPPPLLSGPCLAGHRVAPANQWPKTTRKQTELETGKTTCLTRVATNWKTSRRVAASVPCHGALAPSGPLSPHRLVDSLARQELRKAPFVRLQLQARDSESEGGGGLRGGVVTGISFQKAGGSAGVPPIRCHGRPCARVVGAPLFASRGTQRGAQ